jgi:hypothetical protein
MMLHPLMASALASEHRRDMITLASRDGSRRETASPRGPRRTAPRYRVSWSGTTLSPAGADGHGRSWIIVISATRGV